MGFSQAPVVLIIHASIGLLLLLNSIFLLVRSMQLTLTFRVLTALGLVGILGAGINGASFLVYNQDVNSYLMSVGFALAAVVYVQILFASPIDPAQP